MPVVFIGVAALRAYLAGVIGDDVGDFAVQPLHVVLDVFLRGFGKKWGVCSSKMQKGAKSFPSSVGWGAEETVKMVAGISLRCHFGSQLGDDEESPGFESEGDDGLAKLSEIATAGFWCLFNKTMV